MDLFSGAHSQDQSWAQLGKQKVLSEYQEALFFFFAVRLTKQWHRLLREILGTPSLAIFKSHLDIVLSSQF